MNLLKNFLFTGVLFGLIFLSACVKDKVNPIKCVNEAADVSEAASDFSDNQTKANCEAYREALLDYIDACNTDANYDYYESIYEDLDCSNYN